MEDKEREQEKNEEKTVPEIKPDFVCGVHICVGLHRFVSAF
jgi:hypothetical protein